MMQCVENGEVDSCLPYSLRRLTHLFSQFASWYIAVIELALLELLVRTIGNETMLKGIQLKLPELEA